MLDHHIFKECHYGNILKLANRNNTWKKWAVPEFVWHGLKGSIFEEEPIKPKKIMTKKIKQTKKLSS